MDIIKKIERENMRMDMPVFRSGDTVKVHLRIVEGEKERIQVFQGNVIRIQRGTTDATFTVRKISDGVGVERIFPLHSPFIDHVEVVSQGRVRRSRLYYLRALKGKVTIVLTTHYMEEAEELSDRIGIMRDGHLLALGTAAELKALAGEEKFENAFVKIVKGGEK